MNAGLDFQGQILAKFAVQELHVDRGMVTLTDDRREASVALIAAFTKEFSRINSARIFDRAYKRAAEAASLIEFIKKAQPQALLYAGTVADLVKLRTKLLEAGVKLPILVGGAGEHMTALLADHETGAGVFVAATFIPGLGTPQCQEFAKIYQKHPCGPDAHAALAYDGVRLLLEAMRRAKARNPPSSSKNWRRLRASTA